MTTPYLNYTFDGKNTFDDGAGKYAQKVGQLLSFTNAREEGSHEVSFIAFLGSFSQSFTSNWNQESVIGRMDDIATFKNTTRTLSIEWTLPAGNSTTAFENLNRCNALISMLYPSYIKSSATVMSKPPLVRLRYANLVRNQNDTAGLLGYITSLNWTPQLEMGFYHSGENIYPKVISLSVEFTVLHEPNGATGAPTGFFPGGMESLAGSTEYKGKPAGHSQGKGWPFGVPSKKEGDTGEDG